VDEVDDSTAYCRISMSERHSQKRDASLDLRREVTPFFRYLEEADSLQPLRKYLEAVK
jgi:hypothetical protein